MVEIIKNIKLQMSKNGTFISNLVTYGLLFKNLEKHYKIVKNKEFNKMDLKESPYSFLKNLLLETPNLLNEVAIKQDKSITYERMMYEIRNLSNYLHYNINLKKGDNISICDSSSIEGIIAFFAMNNLGLVNSRIFNGSKEEKFINDLMNFDSETIFVDNNNLEIFSNIVSETKIRNIILMPNCDLDLIKKLMEKKPNINIKTWDEIQSIGNNIKEFYEEDTYLNDLASILYTSGSSGDPKPISIPNRTYTNMVKSVKNTTDEKIADGEKVLGVVSHEYPYAAINSTIMILLLGKTLIMPKHSENKELNFSEIFEKTPDKIQAIPSFYKLLESEIDKISETDDINNHTMVEKLKTLKYIVSGGETYQVSEKKTILKKLGNYNYSPLLIDGFGFGEMGSATALKFGLNKYFLLLNGVEAKAIDPKTKKDLPKDREGILCLSGPTIAQGYYNNEQSTKESFVIDENGKQWFISDTFGSVHGICGRLISLGGRIRECFITSDGMGNFVKVYSGNVENVILSTGLVEDCIVIQSDSSAVPKPVAYVSLKNNCNLSKNEVANILLEKCHSLEEFSQPIAINFEEDIKRTDADKKDYSYYRKKYVTGEVKIR